MQRPYIVGLGGTTRVGSSTEKALSLALKAVASQDADTLLLCGADLDLPASRIATVLSRADGIILGTPSYHGGISGLVENALDYTEELRGDKRPYLEGRSVGCLVTAAGEQGAMTTLGALRSPLVSPLSPRNRSLTPQATAYRRGLRSNFESCRSRCWMLPAERQESLRAACTQARRRVRLKPGLSYSSRHHEPC
jgi:NAD(P)H-dependent FMN reductase